MLVKAVTLKETALDWAVAKALNLEVASTQGAVYPNGLRSVPDTPSDPSFSPSRYQSQGAQILDDNGITTIYWECNETNKWTAYPPHGNNYIDVDSDDGTTGPTRLVAGLRELVRVKLGSTVEIPENLLC